MLRQPGLGLGPPAQGGGDDYRKPIGRVLAQALVFDQLVDMFADGGLAAGP